MGARWATSVRAPLGNWVLGRTCGKPRRWLNLRNESQCCAALNWSAQRRTSIARRGLGRSLAAAELGGASFGESGQWGRGGFRSLVALHDTLCGRCIACSTWAWARGGPASLGRRCTHARARRRGGGRLASSSSLLRVFDSPETREMSLLHGDRALLCFGATRRPRRSAWRPGMVVGNSGARGVVSSPLWGTAFRCALNALCPFA